MKILAVDHNALDISHRSVYDALSRYPDVKTRLLVPSQWFDNYQKLQWEDSHAPQSCEVLAADTFFHNRTHRLVYRSLRKHLREFQPDVLYMNSEPENFQTFQAALLHRRPGPCKLVFSSWRNIDYSGIGFPYKFSFLNSLAERFVLKNAAHCIAFNESAKRIFEQKGFRDVTVIPPCVDTALFRNIPEARSRLNIRKSDFVVGFVGRFIHPKGVDTLLSALSGVSFDYTLVLVGDGPAKLEWQDLGSKLGIAGKTMWFPAARRSEVPQYLSCMDVVVLPSRTGARWKEQFGRVLIEAMACEIPVIGSDSGEIPNVVGDTGLVFPEGDADALRERLQRLYNDSALRDDLTRKGVERVRKYFSVEVVSEQYCSLFRSLTAA